MRRCIACLTAFAAAVCVFTSCGKKTDKASGNDISESTSEVQETFQADPLETKTEPETAETSTASASVTTSAAITTKTAATTTTASKSETTQPVTNQQDPLGGGAFVYNEDGAVVFEEKDAEQDERIQIAAAQALFESACRTQWNFTAGCPYPIDTSDTIENSYGWQYSRITDPSINSVDDVKNDYYKVFSDRYPNEIDVYYVEQNGSVYAMSGARGQDIFYSASKISAVKEHDGDEIVFEVTHYYDGSERTPDNPCSTTETFSVVVGSDGTWKAGQFRLPY